MSKNASLHILLASLLATGVGASCDGTEPLKWYASGGSSWANGFCKNERQCSGVYGPGYSTELACCQGRYGGQVSGVCLSNLPNPPTTSPTITGGLVDFWYPDYDTAWSVAGCKNELPLPFNRGDRPEYGTHLECCKTAYGGQSSGKCVSELATPPTTSPTAEGGLGDEWYPDYETAWSEAGCKADLPVPSGRPTYETHIECCKGAYGGQVSGKCLSELATPPTTSPTIAGGVGLLWYPDYDTAWADAGCKNEVPHPFTPGSRPTYDTQLECCKRAYGGQTSGKCLSELASPPSTSPTSAGGVGLLWYPDYDSSWADAGCKNEVPHPFTPGSRPTYDTQVECCKGAYSGQTSGKCLSELASPPTTSPTSAGGADVYYPNYSKSWSEATCINDNPVPSGRPTYSTQSACCSGAYGGQTSQACACAADPCHSCKCGNTAFLTSNNCGALITNCSR